ncbi:MAG: hypothetical protein ACRDQ5_12695 [Sciscionella sp.]
MSTIDIEHPRVDAGPWPCLPGCDSPWHRGVGHTGDDRLGECSVTTEVACRPTGESADYYQVRAWESAECGARDEGAVECVLVRQRAEHQKNLLREQGFPVGDDPEDAVFCLTPGEARRYAEAILCAANIAEGRPAAPTS